MIFFTDRIVLFLLSFNSETELQQKQFLLIWSTLQNKTKLIEDSAVARRRK